MKYCGIELKSNEARLVCIQTTDKDYEFIETQLKKIKLADPKTQAATLAFKDECLQFFEKNQFDKIGIKERGRKGKFAGGADSFKMEGIIQSLPFPIEILHGNSIKSKVKDKTLKIDQVNAYQAEALKVAVSFT